MVARAAPALATIARRRIARWFRAQAGELVVAAGWLWLLTPEFIGASGDRIINVHPALLPAFPGRHSVERAVEHGVRVHEK